jgi:hypothetical protein
MYTKKIIVMWCGSKVLAGVIQDGRARGARIPGTKWYLKTLQGSSQFM